MITLGVLRVLHEVRSGRGFLQEVAAHLPNTPDFNHFFATLRSERRLTVCQEAVRLLDASLKTRLPDDLSNIAELDVYDQEQSEWVMLVRGYAVLRFEPGVELAFYRSFYRLFPIGPTLSDQFKPLLPEPAEISPTAADLLTADGLQIRQTQSTELLKHFTLGWSQYVTLLTSASPSATGKMTLSSNSPSQKIPISSPRNTSAIFPPRRN